MSYLQEHSMDVELLYMYVNIPIINLSPYNTLISPFPYTQEGDDRHVFFATGRSLYDIPVPTLSTPSGQQGKCGAVIADLGPALTAIPINQITHRAEIQDVQLLHTSDTASGTDSALVATVDSCGRAIIAQLEHNSNRNKREWTVVQVHQLQPMDLLRERGWAGIALAPSKPTQTAIARHFPKDITLFDADIPVRTFHTTYHPTSIQLAGDDGNLVIAAEGPQVSVWDARSCGTRGARCARFSSGPHSSHFYTTAINNNTSNNNSNLSSSFMVGATGADRGVTVWDSRTWRTVQRVKNCVKYEATALHFSSRQIQTCYVGGMDYEVVALPWCDGVMGPGVSALKNKGRKGGGGGGEKGCSSKGMKRMKRDGDGGNGGVEGNEVNGTTSVDDLTKGGGTGASFRGDSRWFGLSKAYNKDVLAGMTANGQLYIADFEKV